MKRTMWWLPATAAGWLGIGVWIGATLSPPPVAGVVLAGVGLVVLWWALRGVA